MQNDLIMNHLPLPKYFDGYEWSTVIKSTRKSIPKYLHEDLPQLKHLYIKQIFKNMGKLNCPNIEFFNRMIKKKNNKQKQQKSEENNKNNKHNNNNYTYNQIKQQLQYALITTDKQSNILDELVSKAQSIPKRRNTSYSFYSNHNKNNKNQQLNQNIIQSINSKNNSQYNTNINNKVIINSTKFNNNSKNIKSQTSRSFRSKSNKNSTNNNYVSSKTKYKNKQKQQLKTKYFQNTVQLVFRNRRNKFIENLKNPIIPDQIPHSYQLKFKQLDLIQIKNQHLQS